MHTGYLFQIFDKFKLVTPEIQAQYALLPNPNHIQKQSLPLFYSTSPNDHFQKLNHKPSNADGTPKENPFNMNFNKMESDANYGKWKAMKGNILSYILYIRIRSEKKIDRRKPI